MYAFNECIWVLAKLCLVTTFNSFEQYCEYCIKSVHTCDCVPSGNIRCRDAEMNLKTENQSYPCLPMRNAECLERQSFNHSVDLYIDGYFQEIPAWAIAFPKEIFIRKLLIGEQHSRYLRKIDAFAFANISDVPAEIRLQIVASVTRSSVLDSLVTLFISKTTCLELFTLTASKITSSSLHELCNILRLTMCNINSRIQLNSTAAISLEYPTKFPKSLMLNLTGTTMSIIAPSVVIRTFAFHKWQLHTLTIQNVVLLEEISFDAVKLAHLKLYFKANWSEGIRISNDTFKDIERLSNVKFYCSSSRYDFYYCFCPVFIAVRTSYYKQTFSNIKNFLVVFLVLLLLFMF